jgi:hypothetical protein
MPPLTKKTSTIERECEGREDAFCIDRPVEDGRSKKL